MANKDRFWKSCLSYVLLPLFSVYLLMCVATAHAGAESELRNTLLPVLSTLGVVVILAWSCAGFYELRSELKAIDQYYQRELQRIENDYRQTMQAIEKVRVVMQTLDKAQIDLQPWKVITTNL